MNENLIINRVSIKRKGQETQTYLLPSVTDILKDGSIKRNHIDWQSVKEYLDGLYVNKDTYTQAINNINSKLITLSIDNNGNLEYNGSKFLNVNNYEPSQNVDELTGRVSTLETTSANLESNVETISATLEGLDTKYAGKSHQHTLQDITDISESSGYLTIGTGSNKFIEILSAKLTDLRVLAVGEGKVYITPKVRSGEKAILVAEPNENKRFVNWTYNNQVISTNAIHILDTPLSGAAYIGTFTDDSSTPVQPTSYTLILNSVTNGTITIIVDENEVISPVQIPYGKRVSLRAVPNTGYKFSQWVGISATEAETSFIMDNDYTISATFVEDETQKVYSYQAHVLPANVPELTNLVASTQTINSNLNVIYGNAFTLTVPNSDIVPTSNSNGYRFLKWTGDYKANNETTARTWTGTAGAPETYTSQPLLNPNGLTNFYANYQQTFLVKVGASQTSTGVNLGQSASIKLNGQTQSQTSVIVDTNYQGSIIIVAGAISGYTFYQWSDGNNTAQRTISAGTSIDIYPIYTQNAPSNYTITASVQTTGTGSVSGGGSYETGASATLTCTPATGYHFERWTDGNTDNPRLVTVTSNATYTAIFELNTYTITTSVSPSNSGSITGLSNPYEYGGDCTITASAATGYHFVEWQENSQQVSTEAAYEFVVDKDRTLVAVFAKNSYTITTTATTGGSASPATQTVEHGTSVTVTATPSTGYKFTKWTSGTSTTSVSTSASYTFNATSSITLKANFTLNTYTISASVDPTGSGTVTVGGTANSKSISHGSTTTLVATANSGYEFVNWTLNGTQVATTASYTTPAITAPASYVAHFNEIPVTDNTIYYYTSGVATDTNIEGKEGTAIQLSTQDDKYYIDFSNSSTTIQVLTIVSPSTVGAIKIFAKPAIGDPYDATSEFTLTTNSGSYIYQKTARTIKGPYYLQIDNV